MAKRAIRMIRKMGRGASSEGSAELRLNIEVPHRNDSETNGDNISA